MESFLFKKQRFIHCALLAAFLFALSTPASKYFLNNNASPILLAAIFYLGAAIFLIPFSYKNFKQEKTHLKNNHQDIKKLAGAVLFGGILGPISLLYGIKYTNATSAALLLNLETVATTFLAFCLFKEHIGKRVALASLLTVIAGGLLVFKYDFSLNTGGILVALACLFWGFDNNFTATVEGISAQTNTIIKGVFAGSFNLILAFILGEYQIDLISFIFALLIGFFSYGLSISLYIYSARHLGAGRSQIIFAANPFLGALISYLFFWDILGLKFFLSLIIMMVAVTLLYYEKHVHHHLHPAIDHEHDHHHNDGHHFHQHKDLPDNVTHSHKHTHEDMEHSHPHYPDLHHRHPHK